MTDDARQFEDADDMADFAVKNAALLASLDRKPEVPHLAVFPFRTQLSGQNAPESL